MERLDATALPVVAVMVIHRPEPWLDESLAALQAQDYPDLRVLLLVTEGDESLHEVGERAAQQCPRAVVRSLGGNPGWGSACNAALDLVEGDRGLFLLLHDDVALEPDTLVCLVEELYRSNAGIVGPKLLEWDDPRRLHRVGLNVDRIGDIDPVVEPGELDQEQHDAVRDTFALPSACLLIRADLFRLLRFDDDIDYHGDDVDLCWRAHLTGARVLLVPAGRARHRGRLPERRPDLDHRAMMARHRAWSTATLTGARRLPAVTLQLVVVTVAELIAGLLTRRARESWSMVRAIAGLVPRLPAVVARRRRVRALRLVPENEVAYLQMRGSARLSRFRRSRFRRRVDVAPTGDGARRLAASWWTWVAMIAFVAVGSRRLLVDGVTPVGEMQAFTSSPGDLLAAFISPWWGQGLGGAEASPTGWALVSLTGAALLGRTGLMHTAATVGVMVVGLMGLWRVGGRLGSDAGRRACLAGGVLVPFALGALASGRWSALVLWAATPWWLDHIVDAGEAPQRGGRRRLASMVLSVAVVAAFVPAGVVVVVVLGCLVGVGTWLGHGEGLRAGAVAAWRGWRLTLVAAVGAVVIHLPWSWSFVNARVWSELMEPGASGLGWWSLAQWGRAGSVLAGLSALTLVPVVAVAMLARGRWVVWGLRAAFTVGGFAVMVVVIDRRMVNIEMGDLWWWMAPAAVGAALAIATLVAAWSDDVATRTFGWRQPLGVLSAIALGVAALAPVVALVDGRWQQPRSSLSVLLGQLPTDADHRVLFVGDRRVVPLRTRPLDDGLGYAVVDGGPLNVTAARWHPAPTPASKAVTAALEALAADVTPRVGRLLAPLGVRFIVVPLVDGVVSTADDPVPAPVGLLERLAGQLDLRRRSATAELVIYENVAWIPIRAVAQGQAAAASQLAGAAALLEVDTTEVQPVFTEVSRWTPARTQVRTTGPSVLHMGVPRVVAGELTVDDRPVPSRTSFGVAAAWDLPADANVTLEWRPPRSALRWLAITAQGIVWLVLAVVATGLRRRDRAEVG